MNSRVGGIDRVTRVENRRPGEHVREGLWLAPLGPVIGATDCRDTCLRQVLDGAEGERTVVVDSKGPGVDRRLGGRSRGRRTGLVVLDHVGDLASVDTAGGVLCVDAGREALRDSDRVRGVRTRERCYEADLDGRRGHARAARCVARRRGTCTAPGCRARSRTLGRTPAPGSEEHHRKAGRYQESPAYLSRHRLHCHPPVFIVRSLPSPERYRAAEHRNRDHSAGQATPKQGFGNGRSAPIRRDPNRSELVELTGGRSRNQAL